MKLKIILFVILISFTSKEFSSKPEILSMNELKQAIQNNNTRNRYLTGDNYLSIDEIKKISETQLSFTIQWDASWREGNDYDAAWIFVKSRRSGKAWQHVTLVEKSGQIIRNLSSDNAVPEIKISPDRNGMIINRKKDSEGDNCWTIKVEIEASKQPSSVEYRVFGLEMVHISEGAYELGTLKEENKRKEVLTPGAGGAPYNPFFTFSEKAKNNYGGVYKVDSENPIKIGPKDGNLYWIDANIPGTNTFSGNPKGTLSPKFPKGYKGFYQMKYELSQQEYCDFLNSLTPSQQKSRDITSTIEFNRPIKDYRNAIMKSNGVYKTKRPNRPCNFISWLDGQAYADWAGLRHMTELEFEKSSRGPNKAIYREYVWGVNEINNSEYMSYSSKFFNNEIIANEENGTELTNGNIHASMFSYKNFIDVCTREGNFYDPDCAGCRSFEGGDGGRGPVRKGIFGKSSDGNRIKAGATYYGAMEMGGNLQEPVVTAGHPSGQRFQGTHGDGNLTSDGFADNLDWLPINKEYAFGGRGGCWKFHENHARISDRFKGLRTNPNRRASHIGFRGVRTDWK